MSVWKQIRAILMPITVILLIPAIILQTSDTVNVGLGWQPPLNLLPVAVGIILIGIGLLLMIQTVTLFITVGKGTLAPWNPTQKLVVRGVYRYVRNPMITGVFCILMGETVLMGSNVLLYWSILFALVNLIYIPLVEEPGLVARFGDDYLCYQQHVPPWIPRFHPWAEFQ